MEHRRCRVPPRWMRCLERSCSRSGRVDPGAPDPMAVKRYSTSPTVHRSGGRTPRRMSSCRRAAMSGCRPTLRSAWPMLCVRMAYPDWRGSALETTSSGWPGCGTMRSGTAPGTDGRHSGSWASRSAVAWASSARGARRSGASATAAARRTRGVRVSRRCEVQARLQQVALRRPRILALRELVHDPLRPRDVPHLQQQQPDLHPRADARAGRTRPPDGGSPPHLAPVTRRTAADRLQQRRSTGPPRSWCGQMRDRDHRPCRRSDERAATGPPGRARHDAARSTLTIAWTPRSGRTTEWGRWAPRRWVIDISPAGCCDPGRIRRGRCRAPVRACVTAGGRAMVPTDSTRSGSRGSPRADRSSAAAWVGLQPTRLERHPPSPAIVPGRDTTSSACHPFAENTRHVTAGTKVWIDLTNSPHVLFFRPILRRLDDAGVPSVVTARDYAQTLGLLELYGIPHTVIGRHGGARLGGKVTGLVAAVAGADPLRARHEGHPAGGQPRLQRPGGRREAAPGCTARCSTTSRAPPRCTRSTSGWPTR